MTARLCVVFAAWRRIQKKPPAGGGPLIYKRIDTSEHVPPAQDMPSSSYSKVSWLPFILERAFPKNSSGMCVFVAVTVAGPFRNFT